MEYLTDSIQKELNCCIPIDYPVEAALGTIDFLAEDVWLNDAAVKSYYRLLNCGFRLGWAAGYRFPVQRKPALGLPADICAGKRAPRLHIRSGWKGLQRGGQW